MNMVRVLALVIGGLCLAAVTGCGGGEGDPLYAAPVGAAVSLAWEPVQDPTVYGYHLHYGRQSSSPDGSCNYENSVYVTSPSATITGLEPDTLYYFSVSAFNGLNGPCSNEVSTITSAPHISLTQPRFER